MTKKKRLTQKQMKERREIKKQLQEQGILKPDKPRLNRKKFSKEVRNEWNDKGYVSSSAMHLAISAFANTGELTRITGEELGVLKMMKCAMLIDNALSDCSENGTNMTYGEIFELIHPIIEL